MSSSIRNMHISMFYRIYTILHKMGWVVQDTGVGLTELDSPDVPANSYSTSSRPVNDFSWVFMGTDGLAWPSGVKVYDDGVELPRSFYVVNYRDNYVTMPNPPSGELTADITSYAVGVREGYPDDEKLDHSMLPIIGVGLGSEVPTAFAIGSAAQWRTRNYAINIVSSNEGELADLSDDLMRLIRRLPLYDFSDGQVLDDRGELNPDFDDVAQYEGIAMLPSQPRLTMMDPKNKATKKEKHRALITVVLQKVE